jgi:hypothetical protein
MPSTRAVSTFVIACITILFPTAAVAGVDSSPQVETSGGNPEAARDVQAPRVELDQRVAFMAPVEITLGDPAWVRTVRGDEVSGTITGLVSGRHGVTRVSLKSADGNSQKFRAADLEELVVEPGTLARIGMVRQATSTLRKVALNDFRSRVNHDEAVFHSIDWPKRSDARLLQLVNPGSASRIRVYHLVNATSGTWVIGGIAVAGDESKAFAVVKDGGDPLRVEGRHYERRDFDVMFADCPEMLQEAVSSERNFHRFAQHVLVYDRLCGKTE